jgi:host factor-I protein
MGLLSATQWCPADDTLKRGSNVATPVTPPIQDAFLKHLCDNNIDVTMFLVNGIKLVGRIKRFDNFTVQLVRGTGTQVVYKHAISAINPAEPVELRDPTSSE